MEARHFEHRLEPNTLKWEEMKKVTFKTQVINHGMIFGVSLQQQVCGVWFFPKSPVPGL